jgi:ribonuclease P protein component
VQHRFRLTSTTDFQRVRRLGKSYAHPLVVLIALKNEGSSQSRFAVAAGRTVGKAVQRNRAKRRLRAALQPHLIKAQPGWDAVVIARQPIETADFSQIQAAVTQLLRRSGLLQVQKDE